MNGARRPDNIGARQKGQTSAADTGADLIGDTGKQRTTAYADGIARRIGLDKELILLPIDGTGGDDGIGRRGAVRAGGDSNGHR